MDSHRDKVMKVLFEIGADIERVDEFEAALAIYGLVIVPIEATEEMLEAWRFAPQEPCMWRENGQTIWARMLVASVASGEGPGPVEATSE